jgi:polysaccharide deacetylase family protein (PEP-CTERM system associated)
MLNAFSVDVEDYFQVGAFANIVAPKDWETWTSRVVENTKRMLDVLASAPKPVDVTSVQATPVQATPTSAAPVKATFFVLGWVAEQFPKLVPEIVRQGHEIASHGYGHQLVYTLTEEEFRDDVRKTRKILQDQSGQPVLGYRAPSFSIVKRTPWAHRVLVEEGYTYDSSVFPIHHDLHGNPDAPREIHTIQTEAGSIVEFPPAVITRFGKNIPTGGGGYFRFFPYFITARWLHEINRQGKPFVFYIHPWEIDPDQPKIPGAPLKSRFRHYLNLTRTADRLKKLLRDFSFTTIQEVVRFKGWE